jgi:hypothetical protein
VRRAAVLLLAFLAVLLAGVPTAPAAEEAAGAADDGWRADRVLVVGVPGLTWDDVAADATPELWQLADGAAIGALSVRAAGSTTCVLDGWATLGAGNRARYPAPEETRPPEPGAEEPEPAVPLSGCGPQ